MLMCDATGLSQRRACRLTGLSLSTCRYEAHRPGKRKLTAVCSHQTRIGNLDAHLI